MKRVNTFLTTILLAVTAGCGGGNKQSTDDFLTVDVTKSYPKKELILQDFMDVEYIPLETTDEFVNQGVVLDIGKKIIVVKNRARDGDIFIFDRNGKGLRKFNHLGQGPEDYTYISSITLDEDYNELFVRDWAAEKMLVYDLSGKFKRSFKYKGTGWNNNNYNFDKGYLICYNSNYENDEIISDPPFMILSKQDGSIVKDIQIPYEQKISDEIRIYKDEIVATTLINSYPIIPYHDSWILTILSSDTVFSYLPNQSMRPFMVRTPSIHSLNPVVFLFPEMLTERYYFLQAIKNSPELVGSTPMDTRVRFPRAFLLYDRKEQTIFEYTVYNGDYSNQKEVSVSRNTTNNEIAFCSPIEAYQLVESYEKGELKDGKLKEIAAKLDAEDNPVIMLVKHKK